MDDAEAWDATFRETMRRLREAGAHVTDDDVEQYCDWHRFIGERVPGVFRSSFEQMPQAYKAEFCKAADEYVNAHPGFREPLARVTRALASLRIKPKRQRCA